MALMISWICGLYLQAPSQGELEKLSQDLSANQIDHKLWIEQPENYPTCLATKPYPKQQIQSFFKKLKLFKWFFKSNIFFQRTGTIQSAKGLPHPGEEIPLGKGWRCSTGKFELTPWPLKDIKMDIDYTRHTKSILMSILAFSQQSLPPEEHFTASWKNY